MTIFEELKASNAWDKETNLPSIPKFDNPWIYTAYVHRVFFNQLEPSEREEFNAAIGLRMRECEGPSGFIKKWPGADHTSHDELMGAAYLSEDFAARAIEFLSRNDGLYALEPSYSDYLYRFVFMLPLLKEAANYVVNYISQGLFAVFVLDDAFRTPPGETNDTLKIWLYAERMRKFPLAKWALEIWEKRWLARGYNPKTIFTRNYLTDVPILAKYAREDFH